MSNNNGKIMLALITGVAAGAALGVLGAPAKGSETRKQLSDSAKKMADTLKEKMQTGLGALAALKGSAADSSGEMSSAKVADGPVEQHA
jgi:gas vesicle protein